MYCMNENNIPPKAPPNNAPKALAKKNTIPLSDKPVAVSAANISSIDTVEFSKYSKNVLFGLGFLYIQLHQPQKACNFLQTLIIIDPEHVQARILYCVTQVMMGNRINADDFNFARRYAPPVIVQMLARRTKPQKQTTK
jgi:hypothetical protein